MPSRAPLKVVIALCAIIGGLQLDEQVCNIVVPLTLHRFEVSAGVVGLVVAIHPAFGFLIQPIVGILGDRIWTPIGRRAFFLILAAPLAALALFVMPMAPAFWQYLFLLILFQFAFAVLWGSDHPLLADLIPISQRTLVLGAMMFTGQICAWLFVKYGIGHAMDRWGEASVYRIVGGSQIVLIALAAFFLGESKIAPAPRPKLTPARYVRDMLGDPILRKFAILGFCYAGFVSTVTGFAVLFVVKTLGQSQGQFGEAWSWQPWIALVCALPVGYLAGRLPKQWGLVTGLAIALCGCAIGLSSSGGGSLYLIAVLFGFGMLTADIIIKPFYSEYLPKDIIGQLTGSYNICYAAGRILALIGTGWIVEFAGGNYRAIWIVAIAFGLVAAIVAAMIPDQRHAKRKADRASLRSAAAVGLTGQVP